MLLIKPYSLLVSRSRRLQRCIVILSSEAWSVTGLVCMSVAAVAGHRQLTSLYVAFLLLEIICDFNDGWVYEYQEVGAINGYGLYLDHMVDVLAAACAAWGCHQLVGQAGTVVTGL